MTFDISDSDLLDIIELIYAAGCDPAEWPNFVKTVHSRIPKSHVYALLSVDGTQLVYNSSSAGVPDEFVASYREEYHLINPYNKLFATLPVGKVFTSVDFGPAGWLSRDPFFNEWLMPAGRFAHGAGVVLAREHGRQLRVGVDLPVEMADREQDGARFLHRIAPHLRRAFAVNERLAAAVATDQTLETLLNQLEDAAAVLDDRGTIMMTNPATEDLLRAGKVVRLSRERALAFQEPATDATYRKTLAAALDVTLPAESQAFIVDCAAAGRGTVLVLPLRPKIGNFALSVKQPRALVIFRFGNARPLPPKQLLQAHHGLTAAEANVALKLMAGRTPQEAATDLGVSPTTVRNQIAAIMSKMGVRRQAELVALLCRLAPALKLGE